MSDKPLYPGIRENHDLSTYVYLGWVGRTDVYLYPPSKALFLQHSAGGEDWSAIYKERAPWIVKIPDMEWDAVAMRLLLEGYTR